MTASSARQHGGASAPVDEGRISPGLSRHRLHVWLPSSLVASFRWPEPLVLSPARKPEETLYVYRHESDYGGEWRVSLGPDQPFAPPPPTWREHLRALGHPLETDDEIERTCREHDLPLNELDVHLNGFG
jgi:hypothetical protein